MLPNEQMKGFKEEDIPVINNILGNIRRGVLNIRYVTSAPVAGTMEVGEIVIFDDGTNKRIYIKTEKENVIQLNSV